MFLSKYYRDMVVQVSFSGLYLRVFAVYKSRVLSLKYFEHLNGLPKSNDQLNHSFFCLNAIMCGTVLFKAYLYLCNLFKRLQCTTKGHIIHISQTRLEPEHDK